MEDNLEDYFDLLLNQLEYELSHLQDSSNFITSHHPCSPNNNNITTPTPTLTPTTTTTTTTSPVNTFTTKIDDSNNNDDPISYNLLTASQIQRIIDHYKLSVIDANHHEEPMEVKWDRKGKKTNGSHHGSDNLTYTNLFGCDVNDIEKANGGLILPPFIENALLYLVRYGINSVGIFRKSGVKSRIMSLRQKLEAMTGSKESTPRSSDYHTNGSINGSTSGSCSGTTTLPRTGNNNCNYGSRDLYSMGLGTDSGSSTIKYRLSSSYAPGDEFCVYDVADMVKMWLREIKPRPLITKEVIAAYKEMMSANNNINPLNNTNGHPLTNSPSPYDLSLKLTVLLTDSQRALLEIFLNFLSLFASNCEVNQMSSQNLAICFTPSLCECSALTGTGAGGVGGGGGGGGITNTMNNNFSVSTNNNNNHFNGSHNNNVNGLPFGQDNGFHLNGGSSSLSRSADTEIIFDAQKCLQYLIDNCSAISMIPLDSLPFSPSPTMLNVSGSSGNTNNVIKSAPPPPPPRTTPKKSKGGGGGGGMDYSMDQSMDTSCDEVDQLSCLMPSLSLSSGGYPTTTTNINGAYQPRPPSNSNLINGGNLLPSTYESSIIINAAPIDILKRILYQRNLFDPSLVEWRIIKQIPGENSDIFEFKVQSSFFHPLKTFTIERKWSFIENQTLIDSPTSSFTLNNTSTFSSTLTTTPTPTSPSSSRPFYSSLRKPKPNKNTFKGIILRETGYLYDSWWKIGTSGEGKCQLDISIAVDLRGHSFYWYTNTFPAIIDWQLYQIKQSFLVDFIETKNFKSTNV